MKRFSLFLLLALSATLFSCEKKDATPETPAATPVTDAIKTGDWMVNIYMENGANITPTIGLVYIKFAVNGTLTGTKNGSITFTGTWKESNSGGVNTFKMDLTTTDTKVAKISGTWKVTNIVPGYIDIVDGNTAATSSSINLMKH
ncbi:MAG: hypothetical protein V4722_06430 [Bacteroidota bacterium]